MNLRSIYRTTYILLMKCSYRFRLHFFEKHISVDLLVHEKIQYMFVRCVRVVILRRDWDLVTYYS
jgi:hypothetical protein